MIIAATGHRPDKLGGRMIIAATGHRPDKLGGYGVGHQRPRIETAKRALLELRPTAVITGMALGWDQDVAVACIALGVPFVAAVPFVGQERKWPSQSQRVFSAILSYAARVEVVSEGGYSPRKMHVRNVWMVDRSDLVLAAWDGSEGGTGNCVAYAKSRGKPIHNVYDPRWL